MTNFVLMLLGFACLARPGASAVFRSGNLRGRRSISTSAAVPPLTLPGPKTPIRLLVSAFQDGERCADTLVRALEKAEHPERVTFEVVQASAPGDVLCDEEFHRKLAKTTCSPDDDDGDDGKVPCISRLQGKLHIMHISLEEAKGPMHQRGLLSEFADLKGGDSMCLATDSHMDFVNGWDTMLLKDWTNTANEFAVLSAYPLGLNSGIDGEQSWIENCGFFLTGSDIPRGATGMPRFQTGKVSAPQLTMNWAAGQSFARCHAERNVPVDKTLEWMFDGEEVNRAVRLWTSGYDLYNPHVSAVTHNYTAASQKFWSYSPPDLGDRRDESEARLKRLLQGDAPKESSGRFGLGDQRSLEQYVTWSKTNLGGKWGDYLEKKGITPHFKNAPTGPTQPKSLAGFCSRLKRVPVRDTQALVRSAAASA